MKPDWKNAPEWAHWLTFDGDGWYWFENEPWYSHTTERFFKSEGRVEMAAEGGTIKEPRP